VDVALFKPRSPITEVSAKKYKTNHIPRNSKFSFQVSQNRPPVTAHDFCCDVTHPTLSELNASL